MTFQPIIRTQQDLEGAWRQLMEPLGFGGNSIWFLLIGTDDRPFPNITHVEDADTVPTGTEVEGLASIVGELSREFAPGGRVAFLRSRPGAPGLTADDRAWAQALYAAARSAGVPAEVVHRACDHDLVPVPMDESLPGSAA